MGALIGWDKPVFKLGAEPFLLAELFKILLLLFLTPTLLKAKKIYVDISKWTTIMSRRHVRHFYAVFDHFSKVIKIMRAYIAYGLWLVAYGLWYKMGGKK